VRGAKPKEETNGYQTKALRERCFLFLKKQVQEADEEQEVDA
jgi:hypothetical protein